MEPQEKIYCYDNRSEKETKKRNCFDITTIILLTAFAVVIGLIIERKKTKISVTAKKMEQRGQSPFVPFLSKFV